MRGFDDHDVVFATSSPPRTTTTTAGHKRVVRGGGGGAGGFEWRGGGGGASDDSYSSGGGSADISEESEGPPRKVAPMDPRVATALEDLGTNMSRLNTAAGAGPSTLRAGMTPEDVQMALEAHAEREAQEAAGAKPEGGGADEEGMSYVRLPLAGCAVVDAMVLGTPAPRDQCFGCSHLRSTRSMPLTYEDLQRLNTTIRDHMGQISTVALAAELAVMYADIRATHNMHRMTDEEPLPPWTAATIADHLLNHNTDPVVQTWVQLDALQATERVIAQHSLLRRDPQGSLSVDPKQFDIWQKCIKLQTSLRARDPSKMMFYAKVNLMNEQPGPVISESGRAMDRLFQEEGAAPPAEEYGLNPRGQCSGLVSKDIPAA